MSLDKKLLEEVKLGFVAMPAGAGGPGPVAGGGLMTQAQAAPMGGGGMPMDPAMAGGGGMPMDPAMMGGGAPMDPAMAGGMPPEAGGMPPEAAGMPPELLEALSGAGAGGQITLSVDELIKLITGVLEASKSKRAPTTPTAAGAEGGAPTDPAMMGAGPGGGGDPMVGM